MVVAVSSNSFVYEKIFLFLKKQFFLDMAGVLRVTVSIQGPVQNPLFCSVRGLRTYARPLRKDAKPAEPIKGIPYKNLTIGVPKEIWTNERR